MPVCLPACLPACLSACLPACLPVCLLWWVRGVERRWCDGRSGGAEDGELAAALVGEVGLRHQGNQKAIFTLDDANRRIVKQASRQPSGSINVEAGPKNTPSSALTTDQHRDELDRIVA
ncbi:hypothetical protein BC567DRAFT_247450 [Phyllosticta citribraziliensis]